MLGLSRIGAALVLATAASSASEIAQANGTNGNGASQGVAERPSAAAFRQFSIPSVPRNDDGTTTPDDYITELADPARRMAVFEEMRNDDAVNTAIDARRQEMNAANWVLASEDKTPRGTEILEFCEDNWYAAKRTDDAIRWLGGGGIHFGFGLVEPVYAWNDAPFARQIVRGNLRRPTKSGRGRRIYLAKLAHIRQPSVESFKVSRTGDLDAVIQAPWWNGSNFQRVTIPADKLLLWTHDRQGDDYWGVPPTRHCYKAWHYKQQLERINVLHVDRFGVGIPVIKLAPDATEGERKLAFEFFKAYRSGAEQATSLPAGSTVEILTGSGPMMTAIHEFLKHYDLRIAKTYLTQGTELGSTETGARALGESFFEQLAGIVQADCEDLAAILNDAIAQLVIWNFGPQETYPAFAPSQRVQRAGGGVAAVIQQLIASGAIHPTPEDEQWIRDLFGMPAVALATLKHQQKERDVAAKEAQDAANKAKEDGGDPDSGDSSGSRRQPAEKPPRRVAATALQFETVGALTEEITDDDIEHAMAAWRKDAPRRARNLLRAKPVDPVNADGAST